MFAIFRSIKLKKSWSTGVYNLVSWGDGQKEISKLHYLSDGDKQYGES
jgi:hypothetical protein